MPVQIGIRKRRGLYDITVHRRVETSNASGEIEISYDTNPEANFPRRADVMTKEGRGREFRQATQLVPDCAIIFVVRYVTGDQLHPLMRVRFRERDLEIIQAENVNELDEIWYLYCREVL
jgi:head-tail adaptor